MRRQALPGNAVGLAGWLFADLLLGLAMLLVVGRRPDGAAFSLRLLRRTISENDDEQIAAIAEQALHKVPDDLLPRIALARRRVALHRRLLAAQAAGDERALVLTWDGARALHTPTLRARWQDHLSLARERIMQVALIKAALARDDAEAANLHCGADLLGPECHPARPGAR
jgi:hypothetical protein